MGAVESYMVEVDARIARSLLLMSQAARATEWTRYHGPLVTAGPRRLRTRNSVLALADRHVEEDERRSHRAEAALAQEPPPVEEWRPWRYIEGWSARGNCDGPGCILVVGHPGECVP